MPLTAAQKHENEMQEAEHRGEQAANLTYLSDKFNDHEKYDNIRFDKLSEGLRENSNATKSVGEKIDNLITVTKTRNEVAVEAADKAEKALSNGLTKKGIYISIVSAGGTLGGLTLAIIEIAHHVGH